MRRSRPKMAPLSESQPKANVVKSHSRFAGGREQALWQICSPRQTAVFNTQLSPNRSTCTPQERCDEKAADDRWKRSRRSRRNSQFESTRIFSELNTKAWWRKWSYLREWC